MSETFKISVLHLESCPLDWAVAKAMGNETLYYDDDFFPSRGDSTTLELIAKYEINLKSNSKSNWQAYRWIDDPPMYSKVYAGKTPAIAAMRCFVATVLGEEIEMPIGFKRTHNV